MHQPSVVPTYSMAAFQFGTMSKGAPQNERMREGRSDDFWSYDGEKILEKESLRAKEYTHEMLMEFADARITPQITEPYKAASRREERRKTQIRALIKSMKKKAV